MLEYSIAIIQPVQRLLQIQLTFKALSTGPLKCILPYWRPGRYERQYYSRNVLKARAIQSDGCILSLKKKDEITWQISGHQTNDDVYIILTYQYFAHQPDAGGSYISEDLFYLNPVNCCMVPDHALHMPIRIQLQLPEDYKIACALELSEKHTIYANDIRQWYDSPVVASRYLQKSTVEVEGTTFNFWAYGLPFSWPEKWSLDLQRVIIQQKSLFGTFPFQAYHFLYLFTNIPFYHGVEHKASTVIVISTPDHYQDPESVELLYGISSHELFHAWNICSIKPSVLVNWDIKQPCYFDTGYIAEGFTTYYGDLMLLRSGVWQLDTFLKAFGENFNRHMDNPARHEVSLAESSIDLWVDGYQSTHPHRKVSIYDKGAIVAFVLDMLLRETTNHVYSLDYIMQALWRKANEPNYTGYTHQEIIQLITQCGLSGSDFAAKYLEGTIPLEQTLARALDLIGVVIEYAPNTSVWERKFGIQVKPQGDVLVVVQLAAGSSAEKQLNKGDKIQRIYNQPAIDTWHQIPQETTMLHLGVESPFGLRQVNLIAQQDGYFPVRRLKAISNPNQAQIQFRQKWMLN